MHIFCLSPIIPQEFHQKNKYNGGGWIDGFISTLKQVSNIHLSICFLTNQNLHPQKIENISYFPIRTKISQTSKITLLINNIKKKYEYDEDIINILNIINKEKPDIIHFFGTEWLGISLIEHINIPHVVHIQGLTVAYNYSFLPPFLSKINLYKPLFSNPLAFIKGKTFHHFKSVFDFMAEREHKVFPHLKNILGRTDWDKNISTFLAPNAKYYHVNEILRDSFYTSPKWNNPCTSSTFHITSTISDSPYKGLDLVVNTIKLLDQFSNINIVWHICGIKADSEQTLYFQPPKDLKHSQISFEGILSQTKLIELLLNSNIYVHPAYIENSSNSICEAQILGLPIIATNVGGTSTLIQHGKNGILVAPNDPYNLAAYICRIISKPQLAQELSKNAIETAEKRHNKENIKQALIDIYSQIFNEKE